ncbi:MAG TPA: FtsX-like permease family protein, partial [Vicinamibacterales bacterium]|nr:FtsX-like permease family protein [Vicinamibacterales bacterium]
LAQDPGFRTSNLVAFTVDPSLNGYAPDRIKRLASRVIERSRTLPGVTDVSMASVPILSGGSWNSTVTVEGYAAREGENVVAYNNTVMPGYFQTLRIPLLLGRDFSERDARWTPARDGAPDYRVAIANQEFVRRYFRGRDPIGRHVGFGSNPGTPTPMEIIGVVGTAHYVGIREEAEPQLFFPLLEDSTPRAFSVYVRTSSPPDTLFGPLRAAMRGLDPNLPVYELHTMTDKVNDSLRTERLVARLSTVLSVCATLLAVIGLYGVMAYTVTRRTREVGIRMALGAQSTSVAWLFVREAAILVGFGCLLGLPAFVGVRPMGAQPAVRHRPAGPCHDRGGVAAPCGSSAGRRDGARAPGQSHQPPPGVARRLTRFPPANGRARGEFCLPRARRLICASEPEPQHAGHWHRPAAARVIQVLEPGARQPFALRQVGVIPQPALDAEAEPR